MKHQMLQALFCLAASYVLAGSTELVRIGRKTSNNNSRVFDLTGQSFQLTRTEESRGSKSGTLFGRRKHEDTERSVDQEEDDKKYGPIQRRQVIAPGFYEAECSKDKKPCKDGKYCNFLYCEDCHKSKMACSMKNQCCKGLECVYGRCDKSSPGEAGTFCEKDSECKDGCCVVEPTVSSLTPICKPKLAEYHQCADVLYRKIWVGDKPDCGPCKDGLECVQKGVYGSHEVCLKPTK